MYKNFFIWLIILIIAVVFLLYQYGRTTMSDMSENPTQSVHGQQLTGANPAINPGSFNNWVKYAPASKQFSSKFPSTPQHATDRSRDSKTQELKQYDMYISEYHDQVYMISVIAFEGDKSKNAEDLLKKTVDDMVASNGGNKLDKIHFTEDQGNKNADFLITNNSYAITGHAFIDKNKLYVLSVLSKSPEEAKDEFDYFLKSFKLTPNEAASVTKK